MLEKGVRKEGLGVKFWMRFRNLLLLLRHHGNQAQLRGSACGGGSLGLLAWG